MLRYIIALAVLLFISCGPAVPQETPPPVTTTTTTTLAPAPCFAPSPGATGDYVGIDWQPPVYLDIITEEREKIGRYTCWPGHEDVPLEMMAAALRERGLCAVKNEDRIMVQRPDFLYEEWGLVRYDDTQYKGCWRSLERAYRGTLAFIGAAQ